MSRIKNGVKRRLFGDEREQEMDPEEVPLLEEVPTLDLTFDSQPLFEEGDKSDSSECSFPADCQTFGEQLTDMGYEKLIVLKAIQFFGKNADKCKGTFETHLNSFTSNFLDFLSAQSELQSENETTNSAEIIKALTVCE